MKTSQRPMFTGRAVVMGGMYLAGKDTNALWLADLYSDYLVHQTTSGLLKVYPEANASMNSGKMVSSRVVYRAVESYLASLGYPKGLLANGWVRVVRQAKQIHLRLQQYGYTDIRFVEFQVNDDDALEARRKRRWDEFQRPDDAYKIAWKRIRAYRKRSAAILAACESVGFNITRIDGSRPLVEVQRNFAAAVVN